MRCVVLVVVAACSFREGTIEHPPGGDGGDGDSSPGTGTATFDAAASTSAGAVVKLSWMHTASGSQRLAVVGVSWGLTLTQITEVRYADMAMTQLGVATNVTKGVHIAMYALVAPPTGPQSVAVTFANQVPYAIGGSTSFTSVDQAIPTTAFVGAMGHDQMPPASITIVSEPSDIVLDTVVIDSNPSSITPGSGQTQRWLQHQGIWGAASTKTGEPSIMMGWSQSGSPDDWAIGAISIRGG